MESYKAWKKKNASYIKEKAFIMCCGEKTERVIKEVPYQACKDTLHHCNVCGMTFLDCGISKIWTDELK